MKSTCISSPTNWIYILVSMFISLPVYVHTEFKVVFPVLYFILFGKSMNLQRICKSITDKTYVFEGMLLLTFLK